MFVIMLWYAVVFGGPELLSALSGYRHKKNRKSNHAVVMGKARGTSQPLFMLAMAASASVS